MDQFAPAYRAWGKRHFHPYEEVLRRNRSRSTGESPFAIHPSGVDLLASPQGSVLAFLIRSSSPRRQGPVLENREHWINTSRTRKDLHSRDLTGDDVRPLRNNPTFMRELSYQDNQ